MNDVEKARLAGAIWIHGSIDIEHSTKRQYYYPRIMLSMKNLLPFDYQKDMGGNVWAGNDGYITPEIGKQKLVEKRLKEILPLMGECSLEKKQIEIALKIIEINKSGEPKTEKKKKLEELYQQSKKLREELKNWIQDFKAEYKDVEKKNIPAKIWNRANLLEDY